jgi:hypothetical protein
MLRSKCPPTRGDPWLVSLPADGCGCTRFTVVVPSCQLVCFGAVVEQGDEVLLGCKCRRFFALLREHVKLGIHVAMQNSHATSDTELHPLNEVPRWTWAGESPPV